MSMKKTEASKFKLIKLHCRQCALITREHFWRQPVIEEHWFVFFQPTLEKPFTSSEEVLRKQISIVFVSTCIASGWHARATVAQSTSFQSSQNTITKQELSFLTKKSPKWWRQKMKTMRIGLKTKSQNSILSVEFCRISIVSGVMVDLKFQIKTIVCIQHAHLTKTEITWSWLAAQEITISQKFQSRKAIVN